MACVEERWTVFTEEWIDFKQKQLGMALSAHCAPLSKLFCTEFQARKMNYGMPEKSPGNAQQRVKSAPNTSYYCLVIGQWPHYFS
jgi:hypothetical protein